MPNCPVDDFTLAQESYEGVTIDKCPHCRGVWLDAGELETIQETVEVDHSDALNKPEDLIAGAFAKAKARDEATLKCIKCKETLIKREYGFASQVVIDSCPNGHGMWLDQGELQKLEQFFEREDEAGSELEEDLRKAAQSKGIKKFLRSLLGLESS